MRGQLRRTVVVMHRLLFTVAATLVVAVLAPAAFASCLAMTVPEQRTRADVIFDGTVLEGPTATGIQRFRVNRYLKSSGPRVVRVSTGNIRRADGSGSITSVSIVARRGERWRIFAQGSALRVLRTSLCDGSRKR